MVTDADGGSPLPDYVRGLLSPAAYPDRPAAVDLVQTHISYVFLAGDAVYKTKKPVDFGFIDQLAAEVRERLCHEEVRLNRRLTRDVYDGVVPILRRSDGTFRVEHDGGGEVVEWAVKMRRLPDEATLDRRLAAGEPPPAILERLVRRLIVFHESADVVKNDPAFAGGVAERAWWAREYGEAEGFIGTHEILTETQFPKIRVTMKYDKENVPVIHSIKRVSKPGLRIYRKKNELKPVRSGLATRILTTSSGVMTDREARRRKIGGEVLCEVW